MCVLSLLLRWSALTCSHHKQQFHHQSKEQVHLHVQPTLSLLSLSESVECVRWESLTGLKWRMDDHIWSCCEPSGGGQRSLLVSDVFSNLIHFLSKYIHYSYSEHSSHPTTVCVLRNSIPNKLLNSLV